MCVRLEGGEIHNGSEEGYEGREEAREEGGQEGRQEGGEEGEEVNSLASAGPCNAVR